MRWLAKHFVLLILLLSFVAACGGDGSDDSKSGADASASVAAPAAASLPLQFAPWSIAPSVAVVASRADDPRIPQVENAVRFWNEQLQSLGSGTSPGTGQAR